MNDFERVPPHNIDAEQRVLGGMLESADAIGDVTDIIDPGDHYRPAHQIVHEAILDLYSRGEPADVVAVAAELTRRGEIGKVGGAPYLHTLIASVATAANTGYYARIVREQAILRRIIEAGTRITQLGWSGDGYADELADRAQQDLDDILASGRRPGEQDIASLTLDVIASLEKQVAPGLTTGFADLDAILPASLAPGEVIIIGARTAVGKSTLALNIAAHAGIDKGLPVHISSLEMRRDELMCRLLAAEARVPFTRILTRDLEERHWDRIARAQERIARAPIVIDDTPVQTLTHIRAQLRRQARIQAARLVVVDYIQLLASTGRVENRQTEVAALSRNLKLIAREFNVPVIVVAQINRNPETRIDKRPQMSDLRESGALENDADKVFLLYRPDQHDRESPRAGEIDVIVAKQRNGPTGTITLAWQGEYCRAMSLAWTPTSIIDRKNGATK